MEGRSVCLISTVPCYPSVHGCVHVGSGRPLISQVNKKRGCEAFLAFVYELKAHRWPTRMRKFLSIEPRRLSAHIHRWPVTLKDINLDEWPVLAVSMHEHDLLLI